MKLGCGGTVKRCGALLVIPVIVALLAGPVRGDDLDRIKAESNLEKRAKLALENAETVFEEARKAYNSGDLAKFRSGISEVVESVELANEALNNTGKDPRKSPKHFKKAEIKTRDLLRRMDGFRDEMNVVDRPILDTARTKIQNVHDQLLMGIMEGRRK